MDLVITQADDCWSTPRRPFFDPSQASHITYIRYGWYIQWQHCQISTSHYPERNACSHPKNWCRPSEIKWERRISIWVPMNWRTHRLWCPEIHSQGREILYAGASATRMPHCRCSGVGDFMSTPPQAAMQDFNPSTAAHTTSWNIKAHSRSKINLHLCLNHNLFPILSLWLHWRQIAATRWHLTTCPPRRAMPVGATFGTCTTQTSHSHCHS